MGSVNFLSIRIPQFEFRIQLPSFLDAVSEEVVEVGRVIDFLCRDVGVVFHAVEGYLIVFLHDVAGSWISIARLSYRTHVDHEFLVPDRKNMIGLIGRDKFETLQKDSRHMGVALEATLGHESKEFFHFLLVVDIFGKDVFVDWVAWRAMNEKPRIVAMHTGQGAQKIPTPVDLIAASCGVL